MATWVPLVELSYKVEYTECVYLHSTRVEVFPVKYERGREIKSLNCLKNHANNDEPPNLGW